MPKKEKIEIGNNKVVTLHYSLRDESNEIVETSDGEEPLVYLHGHKQIISGLEKSLKGHVKGEKFKVKVKPKDGYGEYDDDLVIVLDRSQFGEKKKLKVGSFFHFAAEDGKEFVVRIVELSKTEVKVDGNHPYAGKNLTFDIQIVDVRAATKEEIAHGHVHGEGGVHH